jgi:uncharacterized protein YigA (DUF484 family)
MSSHPKLADTLREAIIAKPDAILDDQDVMHALIAANEKSMGGNIVDLRGIAMERLEARLDRLEDTHRAVIAAAYENLAGTHQVHRCVLRMMEAPDLPAFLDVLARDLPDILRVDHLRLVLESGTPVAAPHLVIAPVEAGFVEAHAAEGRDASDRPVTLRQHEEGGSERIYGADAATTRSEALLTLDLGPGRLPGLLAMGSRDAHLFRPNQGTELLAFLAGATERMLRTHLG